VPATGSASIVIYPALSVTAPASLPAGTVNTAYTATTTTAAGGSSPYTWSATGQPAGLSMSTGGVLSGTPAAGTNTNSPYSVTVTVTDSHSVMASKTYSLTINPAAPCVPAKEYIYLGGRVIAVANCGAQ
jgi:large repetitive protein